MVRIFLILQLLGVGLCRHPPRVKSLSGIYVGNSSICGLDQFLGIPYAQPPVGELRFANPLPYQSDSKYVFNATEYGPGCSQLDIFAEYNGLSEDCLTLNVIRPSRTTCDEALPVMFFIHGGGNANGQSIFYNGTALVQHSIEIKQPIVYVGINYRLGGFGFTNSPAFLAAGVLNLGLKDQYLALQWVHKNIASFGGDPTKVTIFGESAGAADCWAQIHYAYVQNETNVYFRGMITESGAPGSPEFPHAFTAEEGSMSYDQLLEQVNCTATNSIECLRQVPYDVIAPILVNVSVEQYAIDNDWFNADLPALVESNQYAAIPIMHGSNFDEGAVFMPDPFNFPNYTDLMETVAMILDNDTSSATNIVDTYFATAFEQLGKGVKADPTAPDTFWPALGIYTDIWMDLGKRTWLNIASQRVPTWGYSFRQEPPLSSLNLSYEYPGVSAAYGERIGVYHGSELSYVFGEATSLEGHDQEDVNVAITMMNAWISFAYTLDPNNPADKSAVYWPLYNKSDPGTLIIFEEQDGLSIRSQPWTERATVYEAWSEALNVTIIE